MIMHNNLTIGEVGEVRDGKVRGERRGGEVRGEGKVRSPWHCLQ